MSAAALDLPALESPTPVRAGRLRARFVPPQALRPDEVEAIWAFFATWATQPRAEWDAALAGYDEILVARDAEGRVRACAGIKTRLVPYEGRVHALIFTGMTVVDPAYRKTNVIQRAGLRSFLALRRRHPFMPAYWAFVAGSYKAYLLMARNHDVYWPRPEVAWPEREAALVRAAMGGCGVPAAEVAPGVYLTAVTYQEAGDRRTLAAIDDPHVHFFLEANPGFERGEKIACLVPLGWRNWAAVARRALGRLRA